MSSKVIRLFFPVILMLTFITPAINAQLNTNGSFESSEVDTVTGTDIEGWVIEIGGTADAVLQVVDDTVQQGNRALMVRVDTVGTNPWDIQLIADSIPVQQGETYRYSVWAKSSGSSQVTFTVGDYSTFFEHAAIRPPSPNVTTQWQEYTLTFTVTTSVTYIRGPIHFSIAANIGDSIYIDNMRIVNVKDAVTPVVIEAESGEVGSGFSILQDDTIDYVTIQTTGTGGSPQTSDRVISYQVTFPDTGSYSLFVRLRVGSNNYDDDSFFYGNGFGEKDTVNDIDWIFINGLAAAGFSGPNDVVMDPGGLGSGVWKWVNVTRNSFGAELGSPFIIGDTLTQTFQIAAREDGLDIDKLVFGKSYLYFTVANLDSGQAGSTLPPGEVWEGPPLATDQPKFVGNVYSSPQIQNFEAYWNQVTPENAGKWGSVEGTRDTMNWTELDAAYNLAKDNGFPFHFHVLVWGAQQPAWISTLDSAGQIEEITEWFEAVAERYPDIDYLEVVNEALPGHNPPDGLNGRANYKQALGGDGATGWDWVLNAFRMAREIFPEGTRLMLNDFGIISSTSSTATYVGIINLLKAENLIDIIGEQGHAFTTTAATVTMINNLNSLFSTGIPIQITELDIDGIDDNTQLQQYQRIFPALYEHPGVEGITLWGWRRGLWRDAQGAYLLNSDGSERPSLVWLRDYLDTVTVDPVSADDLAEMPVGFQLYNNYPNPFNPATTITFNLPERSDVRITLIDILGEVVKEVAAGDYNAGLHKVTLNASGLASGVYFYRIEAGRNIAVKKLILMK